MPELAYVGQVTHIYPIPGADFIESLEVVCGPGGRWRGTAKKGDFAPGVRCEVYLQDALLPQSERFAFLEARGWRTAGLEPGADITELTGVTKYEKPMSANLGGDIRGSFPAFIPKTDEPNFQRAPDLVAALHGRPFYTTLKADGSSGTIFWDHDGVVRSCSRNFELKERPDTAVWQLVRKYDLAQQRLPLALQFEIVGPGVQKNRLGLRELEMRLFNVWHIEQRRYLDFADMLAVAQRLGLPVVDLVEVGAAFDLSDDEALRRYAERTYPNGATAEGVVIRPTQEMQVDGERLSFKVINLLYRD